MMHIDKETYRIKEVNHYKNQTAKTQIVLATSLRKSNFHITRLLHKDFGNTKKWNTYTISRDGKVYQHYDDKFHSDFIGIKDGDKGSISIVLENMGSLFQTDNHKYINWLNEYCEEENVVEKEYLGYVFWERIPDKQIESLISLCLELCEKYNIPKTLIEFQHYHKDIPKFRGVVFKSNYFEDSGDINPLFEIDKLNLMLRNKSS